MKAKNKITAYVLSLSMIAAFSNSISVYAEETPTSGTFNEKFSWEFSGDTLTFSVDENYTSNEYVTLSTGGKSDDYEARPWRAYLSQVKHIVFDKRIESLANNIWTDFYQCYTDESINFETVTFGEAVNVVYDWYFDKAVLIAPKYSYTDYTAFLEGVSFEPNGISENPYIIINDEGGKFEYIEDLSLLKIDGELSSSNYADIHDLQGRYKFVLLSESATDGIEVDVSSLRRNALTSISSPLAIKNVITLCYSSFGDGNIENLRTNKKSVVCLGEANPELKGDVTLDGVVDISDSTAALGYYAKRTAGLEASFKDDEELNKFSYYLADTDTESINGADSENAQIDISDATNILTYYAQSLAGLEPDWETIVSGN
jgi:hypothetical protein